MAPLAASTADRKVNHYPVPRFNSSRPGADFNHFSSRLVTRDNQTRFSSLAANNGFAVVKAHIAATQGGSAHLNKHLAKARYGVRMIDNIYSFVTRKKNRFHN